MRTHVLVIAILALTILSASFHDWDNGMTKEYNYAMALIHQSKYSLGVPILIKIGEKGDAAAQFQLGIMYEYGFGVSPDIYQSQTWYRASAESGYLPAKQRLTVISQEFSKGLPALFESAERGDIGAQHSLAIMYKYGLGVPEDERQSQEWYRKCLTTQLKIRINSQAKKNRWKVGH